MAKLEFDPARPKPLEWLMDVGFTFAVYMIGVILFGWLIPQKLWILGGFTPWVLAVAPAWPAWKWARRTLWIQ